MGQDSWSQYCLLHSHSGTGQHTCRHPHPQASACETSGAPRRRPMDRRHCIRRSGDAAVPALQATGRQVRGAPSSDGDASWLWPGCKDLCHQHSHEQNRGPRAIHGALSGAGPPLQPTRLLELVRHLVWKSLWRDGFDHECRRPSEHHVRRGPNACRGCRTFGRREHGRATCHAASRPLQGGGHAFRDSSGDGALHHLGAGGYVRSSVDETVDGNACCDGYVVATLDGDTRWTGQDGCAEQWAGRGPGVGRRSRRAIEQPAPRPAGKEVLDERD